MYLDTKALRERLREIRKEKGYTQEQMADRLGVSEEYYARIERGLRACTLEFFSIICGKFDIDANYLLFGKKDRSSEEKKELLDIAKHLTEIANRE